MASGVGIEEGSFAHRMLKKHGWSQGEGLGKNGQGIREPVKASLKFDTAGVGHDPGKEFTFNWWEHAYKEASSKIAVVGDETTAVSLRVKRKKSKKTKERETEEKKTAFYDRFVQTATLDGAGAMIEKAEIKPRKKAKKDQAGCAPRVLSDEELFAACGGLTAHKGARHGHKMEAKQERIRAQEQELLEHMKKVYKKDLGADSLPKPKYGHKPADPPKDGEPAFSKRQKSKKSRRESTS